MLVFYLAALDSDDDKNKFEYIYRKYYRFMLHTAAGIIKNPTLAEDAVHETFVQLLRGIDTLRIDNGAGSEILPLYGDPGAEH